MRTKTSGVSLWDTASPFFKPSKTPESPPRIFNLKGDPEAATKLDCGLQLAFWRARHELWTKPDKGQQLVIPKEEHNEAE